MHEERIAVAGQADVLFPVRETAWGPILHAHADGSGDALRWVAHRRRGAAGLGDLARAGDLDAALSSPTALASPRRTWWSATAADASPGG